MIFWRVLWWSFYTIFGVIMQQHFAGLDFLAPGFLLALYLRKRTEIIWLFIVFVLIQEGTGNITFGAALLWYGGQVLIVNLSSNLFVLNSGIFICLTAAILGVYRVLLLLLMSAIQDIFIDYHRLVIEAAFQALVIPPVWAITYSLLPRAFRYER